MTFEELGAALKAEREKRCLGMSEVADQLKISQRQLRALEEGDMASLPHPAYARGFIRSYATWLGLGVSEIQAAIDSLQGSSPKNPEPEDEPLADGVHSPSRGFWPVLAIAVLCVCAGSVYWAWSHGYFSSLFDGENSVQSEFAAFPPGTSSFEGEPKVTAARMDASGGVPDSVPPKTLEQADEQAAAEETEKKIAENSSVPAPAVAAEKPKPVAREEKKPETDKPAANPGQHKLIIVATEECWVHSSADKTDTRQFSLRKGDAFALTFSKSLELKLGNAGGVRLRYDGSDLPPAGAPGQVVNLVFPPESNI